MVVAKARNLVTACLLTLLAFFGSLETVGAQNNAGINVGTRYSDAPRAISTVGPGGWVVVIAGGTGDCSGLQNIIDQANAANVNLVIRGHLNNYLKPYDAKAWVATLGSLRTNDKVYFMPWNEPNQTGTPDWARPADLVAYTQALLAEAKRAGIRDKISLMSPAINITHPNRQGYIAELGQSGYFNLFDSIAINLYDNGEEVCGSPMCNPDIFNNAGRIGEVLRVLGVSGKPVVVTESGTSGGNFYFRQSPNTNSPLYHFINAYKNQGEYPLAIPSYDLGGEVGHGWNLFSPPDVANLLSSFPGGGTSSYNFNQTGFDSWLNPLVNNGELLLCGVCGFASPENPGLCRGTGAEVPFATSRSCDPNNHGDQSSRPVPCETCNQTNRLTSSCAHSFTVFDQVEFERREGEYCSLTSPGYYVDKTWGGTVVVDPSQTIIPFVGKKGSESERAYLADYFEGTGFYYQPPYDLSNPSEIERAVNQAGIWRKLAPKELQDQKKIEMVYRAINSKTGRLAEGRIRDYLVTYYDPASRRTLSARLSEFVEHLPPKDTEDDYQEKRAEWERSDWGKLWVAVPMFTREDTPGSIVPYLGRKPNDQFEIQALPDSVVEKVPHVARLYEVSKAINQLLLPQALNLNPNQAQTPGRTLIASPRESSGNNQTLLAQAGPCANCAVPAITGVNVYGGYVHYTLQVCPSCSGYGTIGDVFLGPCGNPQVHSVPPGCFSSNHAAIAPPVPITCPGTAVISACVRANRDVDSSCQGQTLSTACTVKVDADCTVIESTCGAAPPTPPSCETPPAQSVDSCRKESISGPGDDLCCDPILVSLQAKDKPENKVYTNCVYNLLGQEIAGCHDKVTEPVSREIGVALAHPYLSEIWDYTTQNVRGFFNIFRPAESPQFPPLDASSRVGYGYSSSSGRGGVSPGSGEFYFPYLGGIQKAKDWVVKTLSPPSSRRLSSEPVDTTPLSTSWQDLFNRVSQQTGVPTRILEAVLKVETPSAANFTAEQIRDYSTPGHTIPGCGPNQCSAAGPMQMTTGVDNLGSSTCSNCCWQGRCQTSCPNAWANYGQGKVCNLLDNLLAAAKKLKNDSGAGSANWTKDDVYRAITAYYGNCQTTYARLNNLSYCEFVWQYYNSASRR